MNEAAINKLDWNKNDGLLPAVIQEADTGRVLMLGYQNREALNETLARERVVFFSRSRQTLWEKGETSGNTLHLVQVQPDCDGDTLLIQARPAGPTCHTGAPSCFDNTEPSLAVLTQLEQTVNQRATANQSESYTARLLADGPRRVAQKVGEEGVETALAAVAEGDEELAGEAADLLYHLIVLLRSRNLRLADVTDVLARRKNNPP